MSQPYKRNVGVNLVSNFATVSDIAFVHLIIENRPPGAQAVRQRGEKGEERFPRVLVDREGAWWWNEQRVGLGSRFALQCAVPNGGGGAPQQGAPESGGGIPASRAGQDEEESKS